MRDLEKVVREKEMERLKTSEGIEEFIYVHMKLILDALLVYDPDATYWAGSLIRDDNGYEWFMQANNDYFDGNSKKLDFTQRIKVKKGEL